MNWMESIRIALEGIWVNKLRAFLTMLGIVIGVAAVILVVAIGQGGRAKVMSEMEKIGSNFFVIYIMTVSNDTISPSERMTLQDVQVLKDRVPTIMALAPSSYEFTNVQNRKGTKPVMAIGTTGDLTEVRNLNLARGRFFTEVDNKAARRVIVIDEKLAEELFGTANPIGKRLLLKNVPTLVIGVAKADDSIFNMAGQAKNVYIPFSFWQDLFNTGRVDQLEGKAVDKDRVVETVSQAQKILNKRHHTTDLYKSFNMEEQMSAANRMMGIMTMIIGSIAGISLFVGGIGVMNIMLVSVTERTREVGIRMALGARRKDILAQFLVEALVISLIGGTIGMILGIAGSVGVSMAFKWPPAVSLSTILLAFLFSAAVGVFFGIYPANKAARLDPIEALRYE